MHSWAHSVLPPPSPLTPTKRKITLSLSQWKKTKKGYCKRIRILNRSIYYEHWFPVITNNLKVLTKMTKHFPVLEVKVQMQILTLTWKNTPLNCLC